MKKHQLTSAEIDSLLSNEKVGRIATINPDGFPYIVPVHYIHYNGKIYIHGLSKGQKIDNIKLNSKVCFEVDYMQGLILDESPCDVSTAYQSVIISGVAQLIIDEVIKNDILNQIITKYVPDMSGTDFPLNMLKAISIIEIDIIECTGKYYK